VEKSTDTAWRRVDRQCGLGEPAPYRSLDNWTHCPIVAEERRKPSIYLAQTSGTGIITAITRVTGREKSMRILALAGIVAMMTGAAAAAELKQVGTITVPGEKLTNFDISFIDQKTGLYYFADRSNKAIDILDTNTDKFVDRIPGFIGVILKNGKPNNDTSGPDGVVLVGNQLWAGDGDSTIKIIDVPTRKIVATMNTGGKTRLDEMAYDAKDNAFIGVNNAEEPPFATVISTQPDHKIIGKITFDNATDGAEQPQYNPADGMFYMSIPELDKDPKKGAIAIIDPQTAKVVKMLPVENCHPAGLAFGPNDNFVLGCGADGKNMPAVTTIMNAKTGQVVAVIEGVGAADMVDYNAKNGQYYTASRNNPGGPVLGVIDAKTNALIQTIALTGGNPHSVASSETTGKVYVPVGGFGGGDGTIHVYESSK
jgi:DNA-binding beta-propeller fold protein YncE